MDTTEQLLQIRSYYENPPNFEHINEKLKLVKCHVLMRYVRRLYQTYFNRLKSCSDKIICENCNHIGIISEFDMKSKVGIIKSGCKTYIFVADDVIDPYFKFFVKRNNPVLFWTTNSKAHHISPVFNEKFRNIKSKILTGYIGKYRKHVCFTMFGKKHGIYIPKLHEAYREWEVVGFMLKKKQGRLIVTNISSIA